uniref:Putative secreted peptide n=1 Tax=Anopheles braziliensis TaxID=58242 RepID=A0A2M3ZVX0_9DIPT
MVDPCVALVVVVVSVVPWPCHSFSKPRESMLHRGGYRWNGLFSAAAIAPLSRATPQCLDTHDLLHSGAFRERSRAAIVPRMPRFWREFHDSPKIFRKCSRSGIVVPVGRECVRNVVAVTVK